MKVSLPEECEFEADKNMLHTIFRNLISNAIKFSRQGGTIEIVATREEGRMIINVSDDGVGMNENTRLNLFRLDVRHSTQGTAGEKGSGLGLQLCKEFVEKHRGQIEVKSEVGQGTTFTVTLPLVQNYPIQSKHSIANKAILD